MAVRLDRCPCCRSDGLDRKPALVAPFIAAYALRAPPSLCALLICRGCGFRFFDLRFDDAETGRLYAGYRGDDYFRVRHGFEPWYSRACNDGLGGEPEMITRRRVFRSVIGRHLDPSAVTSVLDYGGDRGQLLADGPGIERLVFDPSDAVPLPGIAKVRSEADLAGRSFTIVTLCNVLEHSPFPDRLLASIKPLAASLLFIELPLERYSLTAVGRSPLYLAWLRLLLRVPLLLRAVDLWSTAWRVKANLVPPLGFLKLHEHLNFFDTRSLTALLEQCGFTILEVGVNPESGYLIAVARPLP